MYLLRLLPDWLSSTLDTLGIEVTDLIGKGTKVLFIWLGGWISFRVVSMLAGRIEKAVDDGNDAVLSTREKRGFTLAQVLRSIGRVVVLAISVLYRGTAIPVAWVVVPHRGKGAWVPHLERLLGLLAPAVPATMTVLVLTDRGLWSPRLWRAIRENGWHPLMRIRPDATFAPTGQRRCRARELVPGAGWCWVGEGVAYKHKATRLAATLLVVWGTGQKEPWLLLTDLAPDDIGVDSIPLGLVEEKLGRSLTIRVGTPIEEAERRLILATLEHCAGDKRKTAEVLKISLKTLYNRLNVYKA